MTDVNFEPRRSLARRISIDVAIVTLITSLVQLLVIIGTHQFDYDDLALDHVRREAHWMSRGIKLGPEGPTFELPPDMGHYADERQNGYAFRILDRSGQVIASRRSAILEGVSPWQPPSREGMPGFWFRKLDDTRQFYFLITPTDPLDLTGFR